MATVSRRTAPALPAALFAAPALAQGFPAQPVNMVIPFAAGGPTDTVGRLIAEAMSRDLGTEPVPAEPATPAFHRSFWQADIATWRPIIQAASAFAD